MNSFLKRSPEDDILIPNFLFEEHNKFFMKLTYCPCGRRVGDEVPGAVAVLFSPAEVAHLVVMFLTRLVLYEVT